MSPPLVVAFALAGRVNIDMARDPIGTDTSENSAYLPQSVLSLVVVRDFLCLNERDSRRKRT